MRFSLCKLTQIWIMSIIEKKPNMKSQVKQNKKTKKLCLIHHVKYRQAILFFQMNI